MKCYNCGHLLPEDSEFCQYCGKRIETEISIKENTVEEVTVTDEITETAEIDLPDLENTAPEKALDAIIKIQAEETIKKLKENSKNQLNNEEDVDFGLVPEKPIYTLALMSVDGEREYLNQLYTENGVKIKWNRRGSTSVNGINGIIDVYDTVLPSGELYKTIYINMYGAKKSEKAPVGFTFNNVEAKRKKKKPKKVKTKFCSCCGSVVDKETKICSGCGKKYFKGLKFTKFSIIVIIMSVILLTSIIINLVQYTEIDYLNSGVEYWSNETEKLKYEVSDLEREKTNLKQEKTNLEREKKKQGRRLDFYEEYTAIVTDGSKKYHVYGCDDLDTSSFGLYNTKQAERLGYYACSKCH